MSYTIYLRTNKVNGKQYVGQTKDFYYRENDWKCIKGRYANKYIDTDRGKYGLDAFETTILAEVETQEEAWKLEQQFIKELNTKYPNGYNISDGGAGMSGAKHSEETKKKMSKSHTNNPKKSKAINQYDLGDNFIRTWSSSHEIERELGFNHNDIIRCCNGGYYNKKRNKWVNTFQSHNFIWKFA